MNKGIWGINLAILGIYPRHPCPHVSVTLALCLNHPRHFQYFPTVIIRLSTHGSLKSHIHVIGYIFARPKCLLWVVYIHYNSQN